MARRAAAPKDERLEAEVVKNCKAFLNDYSLGYMEVAGQRNAKGSGSTLGFPDAVVYSKGRVFIVEFKRPNGGRLSEDQRIAIAAREEEGIETWVISNEQEFVRMITSRR
jgi:hypothetical protein